MYLCGILLLLWIPDHVLTCSCSVTHLQQQYCHSTLVALVEVANETTSNGTFPENRIYTTNIGTLFKGSSDKFSGILSTAYHDSLCGVVLELGETYVVAGKLNDLNQMKISLCGLVYKWSQLSDFQRTSLKKGYGNSCQCQIIPCYNKACEPSAKTCYLNTYNYKQARCIQTSSLCVAHNVTGGCAWDQNTHIKKCTHNGNRETLRH